MTELTPNMPDKPGEAFYRERERWNVRLTGVVRVGPVVGLQTPASLPGKAPTMAQDPEGACKRAVTQAGFQSPGPAKRL